MSPYDVVVCHRDDFGRYHCHDGPAIILRNGDRIWYRHGKLHREYGPAIERTNGHKVWWCDGKWHREDGPAVEYVNGLKRWFIEDQELSEEQHSEIVASREKPKPIPETPFQKLIALFTAHPELIEKSVDVAAEVEKQIQHQI